MRTTNTLAVGTGQAGLVASRCLTDHGQVVFDRGRIGQRWCSGARDFAAAAAFTDLVGYYTPAYNLQTTKIRGRCMDVAAAAIVDGAQLQIWTCSAATSNPAQLWSART